MRPCTNSDKRGGLVNCAGFLLSPNEAPCRDCERIDHGQTDRFSMTCPTDCAAYPVRLTAEVEPCASCARMHPELVGAVDRYEAPARTCETCRWSSNYPEDCYETGSCFDGEKWTPNPTHLLTAIARELGDGRTRVFYRPSAAGILLAEVAQRAGLKVTWDLDRQEMRRE